MSQFYGDSYGSGNRSGTNTARSVATQAGSRRVTDPDPEAASCVSISRSSVF